jgi:hypothetical protein
LVEQIKAVKFIIFYIVFVSFIFGVTAPLDVSVFGSLTPEQASAIGETPTTDILSLLNRFYLIATLTSEFAVVNFVLVPLTVGFIICVALLINEFVPFT